MRPLLLGTAVILEEDASSGVGRCNNDARRRAMTTARGTTRENPEVACGPVDDPAVDRQSKPPVAPSSNASPRATGHAQLPIRRGRQRTPKPWLTAVLCRLRIHKGPWGYLAKGNCTQGRECGPCGSVHARTRHRRVWSYARERDCQQVRSCTRCSAANDARTRHQWSETYEVERSWWSDRAGHRCLRCGETGEWSVYDDD